MKKTFETEVLGTLTKSEFAALKQLLDTKDIFTERRTSKRLSIQLTDYARHDLDTRIRITNGHAEIMQKIGDWNAPTREELSVNLPLSAETIFKHYRLLDAILVADTVQKNIIQMENYTYATAEYEIKLTHQYGRSDAYNFEVEVFNDSLNPQQVCGYFKLKPDSRPHNAEYWDAFNKRVNLEIRTLTERQVFEVIRSHCRSA